MNQRMMEWVACPKDGHHPLGIEVKVQKGEEIEQGELLCSSCGRRFPIESGIIRFLEFDRDQLSQIKRQEMEGRDKIHQRVQYQLAMKRLPELDAIRSALGDCAKLRALDAGCGIGLMTQAIRNPGWMVGMDFSWQGLLKFRRSSSSRIDLVQGDVNHMPFRADVFDVSISSQVIEHLPSQWAREAFISELARVLKPGGRLCITAYNWIGDRREAGEPKEGFHQGGIFFHSYEADEFRAELEKKLVIRALWGIQVIFPKTYRFVAALGKKNVYWDRFWRTKKISLRHSKLLLALCQRP